MALGFSSLIFLFLSSSVGSGYQFLFPCYWLKCLLRREVGPCPDFVFIFTFILNSEDRESGFLLSEHRMGRGTRFNYSVEMEYSNIFQWFFRHLTKVRTVRVKQSILFNSRPESKESRQGSNKKKHRQVPRNWSHHYV